MNILLTNDDGIESQGILKLAQTLRSKGGYNVFILAPDSNRSGISHGLSIVSGPIKLTEVSKDTWTCGGFPADCVILAVLGVLPFKPDIIVSGINQGPNVGIDILYSGTAAAARQGALMGLPSVAFSLNAKDNCNWEMAALYSAEHLDEFLEMWESDIFINVNIPNKASGPDGMVKTRPVDKNYNDTLSVSREPGGGSLVYLVPGRETAEKTEGTDWEALSKNLVSASLVYTHPVIRQDLCPGVRS